MDTPAAGTVVDARYRVERVLGRGGMGLVMEARHLQLGTLVALKFLRYDSDDAVARFLREARASAALNSEHVCRVFDVGMYKSIPYLVMERLVGNSLRARLRAHGRLPVHEACDYVRQACAGLSEAHAMQIVHRDLKPSNLFLTSRSDGRPVIKILDFGIAKVPHHGVELTSTDAVLGSPGYMSLEQLRATKFADHRSDIWSLGIILFELIAGHRPFASTGIADLALQLVTEATPSLPHGPVALDPIIACCLARSPEYRYRDVGELADVLAPFCEARPTGRRTQVSLPTAVLPPPQPPIRASTTLSAEAIYVRRPKVPKRLAAIATIALCAGSATVGTLVEHGRTQSAELPIATTLGTSLDAANPPVPPTASPPTTRAAANANGALNAADSDSATTDGPLAEDSAARLAPPAVKPARPRHTGLSRPKRPTIRKPPPEHTPGIVELSEKRQ